MLIARGLHSDEQVSSQRFEIRRGCIVVLLSCSGTKDRIIAAECCCRTGECLKLVLNAVGVRAVGECCSLAATGTYLKKQEHLAQRIFAKQSVSFIAMLG